MKIFSTVRHDFVNDQCVVSVAVLLNCSRRVVPKILIQYLVGGGGGGGSETFPTFCGAEFPMACEVTYQLIFM